MDLVLGLIVELIGECLIECVFELLTRVSHWFGLL